MEGTRTDFLLYEAIELKVRIQNSSSQPLNMNRMAGNTPWIQFSVISGNKEEIGRTSVPWSPPAMVIMGGEVKTVSINLTPLFFIRDPGDYKVSAHVTLGDQEFISRPLRISITRGQAVWQKRFTAAPDPKDPEKNERPRLYSLLVHNTSDNQILYVRIMDPSSNRVYCTTSLGSVVNYEDPHTRVDLRGDLHILHQSGTRIFTYNHFEPSGKLIKSRFFANMGSAPELVASSKGETEVIGGEEIFKTENGMMELVPTAPVMKVKPLNSMVVPGKIPEKKD